MAEIFYYHLTRSKVENALPILLERAIGQKYKIIVQVEDEEKCKAIDAMLWTYKDDTFLPHGAEGEDNNPNEQPIWITTKNDNPNDANVRFLTDDTDVSEPEQYKRIVRMFDGHDADALNKARERWKSEKTFGHPMQYWKQDDNGKWVNKTNS